MASSKFLARIGYNKQKDAYELLISSDNGESWNMSTSCKCVRKAGDKADEEPMFVSISLIEELKNAISLGYRVVY